MSEFTATAAPEAMRCPRGHSGALRLSVLASHPSDERELELCLSCPPAGRYRELPRQPYAEPARS